MAVKDAFLLKVDSGFVIIANQVEEAHYMANLFDQILTDYYRFSIRALLGADSKICVTSKLFYKNPYVLQTDEPKVTAYYVLKPEKPKQGIVEYPQLSDYIETDQEIFLDALKRKWDEKEVRFELLYSIVKEEAKDKGK
jgi:hypothetical protein